MKVAVIFKNKDVFSSSEESPGLCCCREALAAPLELGDAAAAPAVGTMMFVPGPSPGCAKLAPDPL